MDNPKEIDSVYWDEASKSWKTQLVKVEEYHVLRANYNF